MATKSSNRDPFDQWRSWLDRTERQLNKALNEAMSSEPFGKAQSKVMEIMLGLQKSTNEATRRYFETLNLPSRTDILNLGEKLDQIEQRLDRVDRAVAKLAGGEPSPAPSRPRPKRTKKPPQKGEAAVASAPVKKTTAKKASRKKAARKKATRKKATRKAAKSSAKKKTTKKGARN